MPINFHDESNRHTYATRTADPIWLKTIASLVQPHGKTVLDIGCGGGIYTRAWASLDADNVIGIDSSETMLQTAAEISSDYDNICYQLGHAAATRQKNSSAEIVFERALIHHFTDLQPCITEAYRLLIPQGIYLIQDRTMEDVQLPGSENHIRGYIFEAFPKLLNIEKSRRHSVEEVNHHLLQAGFKNLSTLTFWEPRQTHPTFSHLAEDIRKRTGRSILHELTNAEVDKLIDFITAKISKRGEITEKDRWTLWYAQKPT